MDDAPDAPFDRRLFLSLRAEREPWLEKVYVPPPGAGQFASRQSMIFYAGRGGGKTALRLALARRLQRLESQPVLVVSWLVGAPGEEIQGNALARYAMRQVINACAGALLRKLAAHPLLIERAPAWALEAAAYFLHEFMAIDPHFYLMSAAGELHPAGVEAARRMLALPRRAILKPNASSETTLQTLQFLLTSLGLAGAWVLIDGLDDWPAGARSRAGELLAAMLETLPYFDHSSIVFKVFVPSEYFSPSLAGVDRDRLQAHELKWGPEALARMVGKRMEALTGRAPFVLADLCPSPAFAGWLARFGGGSPYWWLLLAHPFVTAYLEKNCPAAAPAPLSDDEWQAIARLHPPPLRLDFERLEVYLGAREVEVPPNERDILGYLYRNLGRVCTHEEVYYHALRGLERIPRNDQEPGYEYPKVWRGSLDTAIWRLRGLVEPDPKKPVYLLTRRGKGLELQNTH